MTLPRNALRVTMVLGKSTGGIGTHVVDLVRGLRAHGVEVTVVTAPLTARTFGIEDAVLAWPDPRHPSSMTSRRVRAALRSADVVHAHGHQAGALVAAGLSLGSRGRTGVVVSLHNEIPALARGPRAVVAWAIERAAIRGADLVTGASSDLVTRARSLGAAQARLARVPSPRVPRLLAASTADRDAARERVRSAYGLEGDRPLVVTISRIAPQKDLGTLLDAAAGLAVDWLVAGDGVPALRAQLEREIVRRGLPVRLIGAVADPEELLLAADIFALTSSWEARALVVQEAMAAGAPVVASDVGGLPDLLAETGTLVPAGAAAGFGAAIERLIADPVARAAQGAHGRAIAATWPDSDAMAREWVAAYSALAEPVG